MAVLVVRIWILFDLCASNKLRNIGHSFQTAPALPSVFLWEHIQPLFRSRHLNRLNKRLAKWQESFTASCVIIEVFLMTHRGIKLSSDDRPRLSWRAPAMRRRWPLSWSQNSCSGPKHLRLQRVKQTRARPAESSLSFPTLSSIWVLEVPARPSLNMCNISYIF